MSNSQTLEENLINSPNRKLDFIFLKDISGVDSEVKLIKVGQGKFVLKTFRQRKLGQKYKISTITKRNREYYYQLELQNLGLSCLNFRYLELVENDQLCMDYIENLELFSTFNEQEFAKLGEFIKNLIKISQNKTTKIVDQNGIKTKEKNSYFIWLKNIVANRKMESHFVQLGLKIIEELQQKTEYLSLLHSDFHTGNIGLINKEILLFDSGECPYLYGHPYHDITRQIMYEPAGIIFENEDISTNLSAFLQSMNEFVTDIDFLKFCYLQSILIKNNSFIARRREITEHLFEKLSS